MKTQGCLKQVFGTHFRKIKRNSVRQMWKMTHPEPSPLNHNPHLISRCEVHAQVGFMCLFQDLHILDTSTHLMPSGRTARRSVWFMQKLNSATSTVGCLRAACESVHLNITVPATDLGWCHGHSGCSQRRWEIPLVPPPWCCPTREPAPCHSVRLVLWRRRHSSSRHCYRQENTL